MGACIGVLAGTLIHKRKSPYILGLVSGLAGGALGFTTGMAWGTRRLTGGMARGAARNIGVVRDGRWLSKNPIDYA
jgi:Na+/H+ antiporter NhaC